MAVIKASQFILRPFEASDKVSLIENINNEKVSRWTRLIPFPYGEKEADEWLKRCREKETEKPVKEVNFTIDIDGKASGGIGLRIDGHKAELGYWLGEPHWGKGIMTEATELVCQFGFEQLGLVRIFGTACEPNKASMRVMEKVGFEREGIMKKDQKKGDQFFDLHLYAKVR